MKFIRSIVTFSFCFPLALSCKNLVTDNDCPNNGPGLSLAPLSGLNLPLKTISLSFSNAPGGKTQEIVDFLYSNNIKATFFITGQLVEVNEPDLLEIKRKGHLVGNGTYSGKGLEKSKAPILDVRRNDRLLTPYISGNIFLLRAPFNDYTDETIDTLNKAGLRKYSGPVQWDIGEGQNGFLSDRQCWQANLDIGSCADQYLKQIKSREKGIVAFHSVEGRTLELVKNLVPALVSSGFQFVRVDEIPDIRAAVQKNGGIPGTIGGPAACSGF